ncbi:MAG: DUF721 domain-containing protein [Planctomycetes bacterium]|nr:DUF721 domain-containing protein [Planctomycetota bacterium]
MIDVKREEHKTGNKDGYARGVEGKADRKGLASIDDALKTFLRTSGMGARIGAPPAFRAFRDAAGEAYARHTRPVRFARGELVVQVSSAAHLAELKGFLGEEVRSRTNQILGSDEVRKINFRLDR